MDRIHKASLNNRGDVRADGGPLPPGGTAGATAPARASSGGASLRAPSVDRPHGGPGGVDRSGAAHSSAVSDESWKIRRYSRHERRIQSFHHHRGAIHGSILGSSPLAWGTSGLRGVRDRPGGREPAPLPSLVATSEGASHLPDLYPASAGRTTREAGRHCWCAEGGVELPRLTRRPGPPRPGFTLKLSVKSMPMQQTTSLRYADLHGR